MNSITNCDMLKQTFGDKNRTKGKTRKTLIIVKPLHHEGRGKEMVAVAQRWPLWGGRGVIWHLLLRGCNISLMDYFSISTVRSVGNTVKIYQYNGDQRSMVRIKFGDLLQQIIGFCVVFVSSWLTVCCWEIIWQSWCVLVTIADVERWPL